MATLFKAGTKLQYDFIKADGNPGKADFPALLKEPTDAEVGLSKKGEADLKMDFLKLKRKMPLLTLPTTTTMLMCNTSNTCGVNSKKMCYQLTKHQLSIGKMQDTQMKRLPPRPRKQQNTEKLS